MVSAIYTCVSIQISLPLNNMTIHQCSTYIIQHLIFIIRNHSTVYISKCIEHNLSFTMNGQYLHLLLPLLTDQLIFFLLILQSVYSNIYANDYKQIFNGT
jgi:hypothetical protein